MTVSPVTCSKRYARATPLLPYHRPRDVPTVRLRTWADGALCSAATMGPMLGQAKQRPREQTSRHHRQRHLLRKWMKPAKHVVTRHAAELAGNGSCAGRPAPAAPGERFQPMPVTGRLPRPRRRRLRYRTGRGARGPARTASRSAFAPGHTLSRRDGHAARLTAPLGVDPVGYCHPGHAFAAGGRGGGEPPLLASCPLVGGVCG